MGLLARQARYWSRGLLVFPGVAGMEREREGEARSDSELRGDTAEFGCVWGLASRAAVRSPLPPPGAWVCCCLLHFDFSV